MAAVAPWQGGAVGAAAALALCAALQEVDVVLVGNYDDAGVAQGTTLYQLGRDWGGPPGAGRSFLAHGFGCSDGY